MSEKLVVHSGGKLTRKTIQSGILASSNNTYTSITAPTTGNYVVSYNGSGYSLVQADAAAAGIDHIDSSFFRTSGSNTISVASSGTIPYFKTSSSFSALDLPSTTGIHVLNVDSTSKSFTTLTPAHIFKDTLKTFGVIENPAIPLWNGVTASSLKLPSAGSWYLQKDSSGWNWVSMNGHNIMRLCWGLDYTKKQIVTFEQGSARSIILPSTNGDYVLNNNNGTFTWTTASQATTTSNRQAFCVKMQVQSDVNLFTNPISITSANNGVFTTVTPSIPSVSIGKSYRLTFHLNAYIQDTATTENTQATITLSGTDIITPYSHIIQDEATNTVRLTFDTIITPTNPYISFSINLSSNIGLVLRKFNPCYLVVQEV